MIDLSGFKEIQNKETNLSKLTEHVDMRQINILEMDRPLFQKEVSLDTEITPNGDIVQSETEQPIDKSNEAVEKQGGSYKEVFKPGEGETYEVHHMPANDVNGLSLNDGPAIKMEKADHRETASCGNSREAREYRAMQKELIEQGKFREALQMDIDDIREKFGDKYDDAIEEMLEYVDEIEKEGMI